jgi:hypothetical protein
MLPKLVYVASIGRSGSTLLELLVGAHPDVATMGELHLWPHEIALGHSRLPCGCGLPLEACTFWQEMRRRADPLIAPPPRLDAFREHLDYGKALRLGRLRDFSSRSGSNPLIDRYAANTQFVMATFADLAEEQTGRRPAWLVDASKDPYRLNWLIRSGRLDITVLHIVRNAAGFVHSERKNLGDPDGLPLLRLAARKSAAWRLQHLLVRRSAALLPSGRYGLVRYEDLATEPGRVVAEVQALLGCSPDPSVIDTFRDRRFHAVGGNPMRHKADGITLDERWRTELAPFAQRITQLVSGPAGGRHRRGTR